VQKIYALDLFRSTYLRRSAARNPTTNTTTSSDAIDADKSIDSSGDVKVSMHLGAPGCIRLG
jgi:hypothetical protein